MILKHQITRNFRQEFGSLSTSQRADVRSARVKLLKDPKLVKFKKVGFKSTKRCVSARIPGGLRALGYQINDTVEWFWVGNHKIYDILWRSNDCN